MKRLLQTIYYYTRTERIGILVLCFLSVVLLFLPRLFPLLSPPASYDFTDFKNQIAAMQASAESASIKVERFPFNPNKADLNEWQKLGVSTKVAHTIINFRKKGGHFYQKKDLQKIYGLSPSLYDSLEAYIQIPRNETPLALSTQKQQTSPIFFSFDPNKVSAEELGKLGLSSKVAQTWLKFRGKGGVFRKPADVKKIYGLSEEKYETLSAFINIPKPEDKDSLILSTSNIPSDMIPISYERPVVMVDINQSEARDWEQLKGIGPAYARRILSFRERLGGFVSIDQVAETYHLPDSTFQQVRPFLRASPIKRSIPINQVDAKTLQAHPFINWKEANAIISYRYQHGNYSQVDDLYSLHALSEETILKIGPYLSFE